MKRIKNLLLYAGLEPETFDSIKTEWLNYNIRNLTIYSAIATSVFFIMVVINLFLSDDVGSSNNIYYINSSDYQYSDPIVYTTGFEKEFYTYTSIELCFHVCTILVWN